MKQEPVNTIEDIGSALLTLIKSQSKLLSLEAALAKQSIVPLLASTVGLMILTVTTWLLCLTLIGFACYHWTQHIGASIIITLAINISLWCLMLYNILRYKNRIRFQKTREHIKQWLGDSS